MDALAGFAMTAAAGGDALPAAPRRRALIVDDELDIRETLAEILDIDGYETDAAASAAEALGLVASGSYDVVLSDLRMPGMNGMEFYRRLRELRADLADRFIVVTGDELNADVRGFLDESAAPVVEKPFSPKDIRKAVAVIAARRAG